MHALTHLLSRACSNLRAWSRSGVNKVDFELIRTEAKISTLENSDFNSISQSILTDLYTNLSALQNQCNNMWAQRARLTWIKDGDNNTTLFHTITRIRAHTDCISQVVNAQGTLCCDQASIASAFLIFYEDLWTSPNNPRHIFLIHCLVISPAFRIQMLPC